MNHDNMYWLLTWFHGQCDGDWEHGNGIKIGTLDNPGWYLKVSLDETEIQDQHFPIIDIKRCEDDWIYCSVEEKVFNGYGGSFNLPETLRIFRDWADSFNSLDTEKTIN